MLSGTLDVRSSAKIRLIMSGYSQAIELPGDNKKMGNKKPKVKKAKAKKRKSKPMAITIVKAPLTVRQLLTIGEVTPTEQVYERKGKAGKMFKYVRGSYIKDRLNKIFGWMWDFEVVQHGVEKNLIWVLGKLTVKDMKGHTITKMQFGRADVKYYRDKSKGTVDFGNDLKAATTDALKKCASELGIARDVYSQQETKEIQQVDKNYQTPVEEAVVVPNKTGGIVLASQADKNRILEIAKELKLKGRIDVAVEKATELKVDWNHMTKVQASKILFELMQKRAKK